MRGSRQRAGDPIRSGPSGAPPPNARAWEVGNVSPMGVLVRYPGALYYDRVAGKGWQCRGTTSADWMDVTDILRLAAGVLRLSGTVTGSGSPAGGAGQVSLEGNVSGDFGAVPNPYGFHGFADYSTVNMSGGTNAYASVALSPNLTGTHDYNHATAVQAWLGFSSSGALGAAHGVDVRTDLSGGVVTDNYGVRIRTPAGTGTITNNYGLYIEPQNRSANSYTIYAPGAEPSKHVGNLTIGDASAAAGFLKLTKKILFFEDSATKFGDSGLVADGAATGDTELQYYSAKTLKITRGGVAVATFGADGSVRLAAVAEYANNAAALAAGLTAGTIYRNGDVLCIVH